MAKVDEDRQTVIHCHLEVELEEILESEMSYRLQCFIDLKG